MDDPRRSRRKSTIQKYEQQKEIELERRTSKLNKSKVNDKNIEVDTPAVKEIDTSQHGAVGNEIVRGIIESAVDEEVFEDEEEDFDPLGAVKSPTKRDPVKRDSLVVTLTRERNKDSDNWLLDLTNSSCQIVWSAHHLTPHLPIKETLKLGLSTINPSLPTVFSPQDYPNSLAKAVKEPLLLKRLMREEW